SSRRWSPAMTASGWSPRRRRRPPERVTERMALGFIKKIFSFGKKEVEEVAAADVPAQPVPVPEIPPAPASPELPSTPAPELPSAPPAEVPAQPEPEPEIPAEPPSE